VSLSWAETCRLVIARAADRCEFCGMHQSLQGATFHVEHILPSAAGGSDDLDNLCLACPGCNLHKADRTTAADPETGAVVPLFHPRRDRWASHFAWTGEFIVGCTPVGRATVAALDLNAPRRLRIREARVCSTCSRRPPERPKLVRYRQFPSIRKHSAQPWGMR
jgi:hypothetical protein